MKYSAPLLTLLVLPCAVYADGFDYTFVEGGIVNTELDAGIFDVDGDGFGINGSFALNDSFHIVGGYSDQDFDFGIDSTMLNVGVGWHTGFSENLDFVADLSYVDAEASSGGVSADETGYGIGAGIRARAGERIELEAGVTYIDLDSSETALRVGGRYYFSDAFALGAGLAENDGDFSWNVGVRAEFGRR